MSQVASGPNGTTQLARTLGLWAIVGLGLGYMTPTVVFDTFGIVSTETGNVVPTAYIFALVVMMFTAISYGRMTQIFPSAGSAYTYTSETISPNVGFLIGWAALLDYLLLPLVNALIIRSYLFSFFPSAPAWIWVVVYVAIITGMCLFSMTNTSRANMILVVFEVVLIGVFLILAAKSLIDGMGNGTLFSTQPLWHEGVHLNLVITGATIVAFSFIGFDAITMYTEEAKDSSTVPKAIMLALVIGGLIFFVAAFFTQSLFPDVSNFSQESLENSALPEIAFNVGGHLFKIALTAAAFAATVASSLASHASVSRLLYVMGRNGRGPIGRFFGYLHPSFQTPAYAIVFVGLVSLLAIAFNLDFVASLINFGALVAFTFVNLTVIVYFAYRRREVRGLSQIVRNIVLPGIGVTLTVVLWLYLSAESTRYGIIWFGIGIVVLFWLTRFFRRPLTVNMGEAET
ncbi:APC family permease [Mycobacterium sp. shizuoka-1]|uniref:APC family permease n=1 Tax=Mycobacterium sp. shizuoka-1 TaxID=2039281 RepID=UPI000C0627F7|nr:APC family permease [Mycobacterium sp. shizuoka-1]GAY19241.1 amino acid permease [Mycobacterium sp. shizuoka-1]